MTTTTESAVDRAAALVSRRCRLYRAYQRAMARVTRRVAAVNGVGPDGRYGRPRTIKTDEQTHRGITLVKQATALTRRIERAAQSLNES